MGTTVTDIRQSPETVAVTLSDGSEMQYDLVVGADGVHSCVRELVLSDYKVEDAGTAVWSFWIPADIGVPHGFTEMWGKGGKAFLLAPVNGQMMGSVALPYAGPLDTANHLQVLKSQIREGEWILPKIADTLNRPQDVFHDKNYQVQAKRWANGRIVLIGDAAHAIHPIAGMGASLALEDAYVLTQEITGRAPRGVEAAASAFVDRRRSRVRKFQWMASISKRVVFTRSPVLAWMRNSAVRCASLLEGFFVDQARKSAEDLFEKL